MFKMNLKSPESILDSVSGLIDRVREGCPLRIVREFKLGLALVSRGKNGGKIAEITADDEGDTSIIDVIAVIILVICALSLIHSIFYKKR